MNFIETLICFMTFMDISSSSNSKLMLRRIDHRSGRVNQAHVTFKNLDDGVISLNLSFYCSKTFLKEFTKISVKISKTFEDENYEVTFFKTKIDVCKAFEGVRSNLVARIFFDAFIEKASYKMKCPAPAGNNSWNDVIINSDSCPPFPTVLYPDGKLKFVLLAEVLILLEGHKRMTLFYGIRVYGIMYNGDMYESFKDVWNETENALTNQKKIKEQKK